MNKKELAIVIVYFPLFMAQFVHLTSWLGAERIELLEYEKLEYNEVPEDAKSYIVNHGQALFSNHGTISQEPVVFALWVCAFVVSVLIYWRGIVWARKNA